MEQQKLKAPKGTFDILPAKSPLWTKIEQRARQYAAVYAYEEIRTPEFENIRLFNRAVGETTDIVQKEMFSFSTNEKETFALKPEGTAGVMRSYIENGMASEPSPVKLFYLTSCYRHEKPQKGRLRQFHQFGVEALGSSDAALDAEVIALGYDFIDSFGVKGVSLKINSVGCPTCRKDYYETLKTFLSSKKEELCDDCKRRLETNPMRVLDCKNERCKTLTKHAPLMLDHLCAECQSAFKRVRDYLDTAHIPYLVDKRIVRGLDYYTGVAFEYICDDLGAQSAVGGGGRYNGLIASLGGADTPGVGFAIGIERLLLIMQAQGLANEEPKQTGVYLAPLCAEAKPYAFLLCRELRKTGIKASMDVMGRSLKAQMKYADKMHYRFTVMLGEDELDRNEATLRDMQTQTQTTIPIDMLKAHILQVLSC